MLHGAARDSRGSVAMTPRRRGVLWPLLRLLLLLCQAALPACSQGVPSINSTVSTAQGLWAAMADPFVSQIFVSTTECLVLGPASAPPVNVTRPVALVGASADACLDWNYTTTELINVLPGGALTISSFTLKHFYPRDQPLPLTADTNMLPLAAFNISPSGASLTVADCIFHMTYPVSVLAEHMPFWMHASQAFKDTSRPCGFGGKICGMGSDNSSSLYGGDVSSSSDGSSNGGPSADVLALSASKVWRCNYTTTYYGGDSSSKIQNCLVVVDPKGCYDTSGDAFAYDSPSLARLLRDNSTASILLFQNITLDAFVFRFTRNMVVARALRIMTCPGAVLHLNGIREAVTVATGGSMLFTGGMTIIGSRPIARYGWPSDNALLLSFLHLSAGASVTISNATVGTQAPASQLQQTMLQYPPALQPAIATGGPTAVRSPGSFKVLSWAVTPGDWEPIGGSVQSALDATAAQTAANASWQFEEVLVQKLSVPCFTTGSPVQVGSNEEMLAALVNPVVNLIEVTNNIQLDLLNFSQQDNSGNTSSSGLNITRPVEVRGCHPQALQGKRYILDWAEVGPSLSVVGPNGHMRFSGDLNLTHPGNVPGRDGMWWLLAPVAQSNGATVEFDGIVMHGGEATNLHDGSSPLWQSRISVAPRALSIAGAPAFAQQNGSIVQSGLYPDPNTQMLQPAPLEWTNISYNAIYLSRYHFDGARYVSTLSSNATLNGTQYIFEDTLVEWWPEDVAQPQTMPRKTLVAIVLVAVLVPLFAALALGTWVLRRRHRKAQALQLVRADEEKQLTLKSAVTAPQPRAASQPPAAANTGRSGSGGAGAGAAVVPILAAARAVADGGSSSQGGDGSHQLRAPPAKLHAELIEEARRSMAAERGVALGGGLGKPEDIVLEAVLGEGTFGKVYKGHWKGTLVAIKTMVFPATMSGKEKREKMAIMETAISLSSSLSHPNVVQTYTYYLTPVLAGGSGAGTPGKEAATQGSAGALPGNAGTANTTDRQAAPSAGDEGVRSSVRVDGDVMGEAARAAGEQQAEPAAGGASRSAIDDTVGLTNAEGSTNDEVAAWEVRLVLEYCDRGSLRDYISSKGGAFTMPLAQQEQQEQSLSDSSRSGSVANRNMCQVLDTAMDIAKAMVHLHSENIIHSDLKARNILLKSSGGDSRGFIAKVADFGLSLRIDPNATHVDNVYQGTMTHMAPEVLLHGKISRASDVYAFGILLWELITGGHAYRGVPRAVLGHEVTKRHLRPAFPRDTPFDYQLLACRCWESDLSIRPTFEEVLLELKRMRQQRQDPMQHHSHLRPLGWPGAIPPGPQAWAAALRTGRGGQVPGTAPAKLSTLAENVPRSAQAQPTAGLGTANQPSRPPQQQQQQQQQHHQEQPAAAGSGDTAQGAMPDESMTTDTRRSTYLTGPISSSTSSLLGGLLEDDELYNGTGYYHASQAPHDSDAVEPATL